MGGFTVLLTPPPPTHTHLSLYLTKLSPSVAPRPLSSTWQHGLFLKSTCDMSLIRIGQGGKKETDSQHSYFLNSICNMGKNKRQGHATLTFLEIDTLHQDPHQRPHRTLPNLNQRPYIIETMHSYTLPM